MVSSCMLCHSCMQLHSNSILHLPAGRHAINLQKLQEKKTFQRIVEKSFSHILLNHKAFNRIAGYGHYRVLYQRHF